VLYLFDIDGTLLLSGGAGASALNRVFAELYGVAGAMNAVSPAGKTDPGIVAEVFSTRLRRDPSPEEVERVLDAYIPVLREEVARTESFRMMPYVVETLDFLQRRDDVLLGLATGNVRGGARVKLEHVGLWRRFAVGGFGDDCPDRAGLVERAIERAQAHAGRELPRSSVVVVGDTPRDVAAARLCGIRAIAVATGPAGHRALEESRPDALFDTLAELPAWHLARIGP
jgi:phosphoglycolate phosphatase